MRVRYSPESSCFNGSCDTVKLERESPCAIDFKGVARTILDDVFDILILQTGNNRIGGDIEHSLYIIAAIFAQLVTSFSLSNSVAHLVLVSYFSRFLPFEIDFPIYNLLQ